MGNVKATSSAQPTQAQTKPAAKTSKASQPPAPSLSSVLDSPVNTPDQYTPSTQAPQPAPVSDMGAANAAAAMQDYLNSKVQNSTHPVLGGSFLDGTAEALIPFYLHNQENGIRQQHAEVAAQIAQMYIDPTDPQAKAKIDQLFAEQAALANQQIKNLPLPSAVQATGQAIDTGTRIARSATFHTLGGGASFIGSIGQAWSGFWGGIGNWFNNNAN